MKRYKTPRRVLEALDANKELLFYLVDHPEEMDKLPRRSIMLTREKIIVSSSRNEKLKRVGNFIVVPKTFAPEKFGKETFSRLKPC